MRLAAPGIRSQNTHLGTPRFCPRGSLSFFRPDPKVRPTGPPRRPPPQRRHGPTLGKQRQPARRGQSPAPPRRQFCQPAVSPQAPTPPAAKPQAHPAAQPGRPVGAPRRRPGLSRPAASETRVRGRAHSVSPHGRRPPRPAATQTPDSPRQLPQVPPSGLGGEGADEGLRSSPPWASQPLLD